MEPQLTPSERHQAHQLLSDMPRPKPPWPFSTPINSLWVANTLRFLQQLDVGYGDYTQERRQLDQLTLDDFREFVRQKSTDPSD